MDRNVCRSSLCFVAMTAAMTAAILVTLLNEALAEPATWTRFHGPDGAGYIADAELPASFADGDPKWRVDVGSDDVGSPVIHDDSIYLVSTDSQAKTISLQSRDMATGDQKWITTHNQEPHRTHARNTLGSCTPTVDDRHVYFAFAGVDHTWLICVDHAGNEVWKRDFGSWVSSHGFGTSPRLIDRADGGSAVVLLLSQQANELDPGIAPGTSNLVSIDSLTGETIWDTSLTVTRSCYGTPAIFQSGGKTQIVGSNTGDGMFGLDAETGEMLWNKKVFGKRCCSTPLIHGDIAIGSTGSGGGGNALVAVRIPQSSEGQPKELYRIDRNAPYVPTPSLKGNRLFMVDDRGIASCVDVERGQLIWKKRIGGNFSSSPIIVGDVMLMGDLAGKITWVRASDDFEPLGSRDFGGRIGATPAFVGGRLIVRAGNDLMCWE